MYFQGCKSILYQNDILLIYIVRYKINTFIKNINLPYYSVYINDAHICKNHIQQCNGRKICYTFYCFCDTLDVTVATHIRVHAISFYNYVYNYVQALYRFECILQT